MDSFNPSSFSQFHDLPTQPNVPLIWCRPVGVDWRPRWGLKAPDSPSALSAQVLAMYPASLALVRPLSVAFQPMEQVGERDHPDCRFSEMYWISGLNTGSGKPLEFVAVAYPWLHYFSSCASSLFFPLSKNQGLAMPEPSATSYETYSRLEVARWVRVVWKW